MKKIELHVLQNFAPSNLNRDDTGAPKDCEFGGYRRARISSQCFKRAVRSEFQLASSSLKEDELAARTKRLAIEVAEILAGTHGRDAELARAVAMGALEGQKLKRDGKSKADDDAAAWKTQYLLFVPRKVVGQLAAVLNAHWDELSALGSPTNEEAPSDETASADAESEPTKKGAKAKPKADKKKEKNAAKKAYPKEVSAKVTSLLEGAGGAVDLALFGRMIADVPDWNVDASCQVAHALSTNRVQMDFDFFTAIDDLKPEESAGSDMMGTVQFNSSCFYRYAVLDVDKLRSNLDGNAALTKRAVDAFVRAFVSAIPTGKQNGTAAHNFPSYVYVAVRDDGPSLSLANAFLKPARPSGADDLVDDSIKKLESYAARFDDVTGKGLRVCWADRDLPDDTAAPKRETKISALYNAVSDALAGAS